MKLSLAPLCIICIAISLTGCRPMIAEDHVSCSLPSGSASRDSNGNYALYSGKCQPLQGVSVTVAVTQDLVFKNGFSIQLNANGDSDANTSWQQYVIAVDTDCKLYSVVNNWDQNLIPIFNDWNQMFTVPRQSNGACYIPVGYELTIALSVNEASQVNGASYYIVDDLGNVLGNYNLQLDMINQDDGGTFTSMDLSTIKAFQLDIVGFGNGSSTMFTSGTGNVIYHSGSALTASGNIPSCVVGTWTEESSNVVFDGLKTANPNNDYIQSFSRCQ